MSVLRQTEAWLAARLKAGVAKPATERSPTTPSKPVGRPRGRTTHPKMPAPTEQAEQAALVAWWDAYGPANGYDRRLLLAVPNGAHLAGSDKRRGFQMHRLKQAGLRAGVPDLMLARPIWREEHRHDGAIFMATKYTGLFLELKRVGGKKPTPEQFAYHTLLQHHGYRVEVCHGFESARAAIVAYLS